MPQLTDLDRIVEKLKSRQSPGRIGTAYHTLANIEKCVGDPRMERYLSMASANDWGDALAKASDKLVYNDSRMVVVGGRKKDATFGSPVTPKDDTETVGKFLLTFDCIATTRQKDRDGDVLEPQGARLDERMPLLWQHMPFEPIGKYLGELERTEEMLKVKAGILDTPLGRDAAMMVEADVLRISHGFKPNKWEPLDEESYGWHVLDYDMMEISLVSIPSNVGAVITAYSAGKFHHPLVKGWAEGLYNGRPTIVKGGWETPPTINLNVNIGGDKVTTSTDKNGKAATPPPKKVKADKTKPDKGKKAGKRPVCKSMKDHYKNVCSCGVVINQCRCSKGTKKIVVVKNGCADCKLKAEGDPEDEEDDEEEEDKDDEEVPDEEEEEADDTDEEQPVAMLAEMGQFIEQAGSVADLPKEAEGRLQVLSGMMEDVRGETEEYCAGIAECGKGLDIAGIFSRTADYIEAVGGTLTRMASEIDNVLSVRNLPDGVGDPLGQARETLETITTALSAMTGKDEPLDATDDGIPDDPNQERDTDPEEEDDPDKPPKRFDLDTVLARAVSGNLNRRGLRRALNHSSRPQR